jgi:beta-RFAP synthase
MSVIVQVHAPSRLHFGMLSFGHADRPQFGGVGVMIEPPTVDVAITSAAQFVARGDHAERVRRFASRVAKKWQLPALPACEINVTAPPDHIGLGVGTQLGLAVAAGLREFLELPNIGIEDLAASVGRGARSAVGTYGFQQGGLIVDGGKHSPAQLGTLVGRLSLPGDWRFVLTRCHDGTTGLAGALELEAFARLSSMPPSVTDQLWHIVNDEMLPAVTRADCHRFGDAVYRFGRKAGECFAPVQGGPFAGDVAERLVQTIRDFGIAGVGQSSWGPTIFAIVPDDATAHALAGWLRDQPTWAACEFTIAQPNNTGAQLATKP